MSNKLEFTPLEEDWRFGTASLSRIHNISDVEICNILEGSVFSNDQLDSPRKINVLYHEIPVVFCDPIHPDDLEINIRKAPKGSNDLSERILNTITHKEFRRGSTKLFEPFKNILLNRIRTFVNAKRPIHIVLPTLPSKGQNSARNDHSIDDVSLGEMLFFAQLRDIVASIKKIYEPGAKITVITDGIIYADMFRNNNTPSAINYRNKCMLLRDQMGLRDQIDIIDMDWILQGEAHFPILRNYIHERLLYLWEKNPETKRRMDSLARGMIFNLPTPGGRFDKAIEAANTPFRELSMTFQEKIKFTALRYAACIIGLTYLQVIERAFPGAIRVTVHPKPASQIGLHLVNSKSTVFPYHGVVLVSEKELKLTKSIRKSSRIVNLYDVMSLNKYVEKVCLKGDKSSLYYLVKD